MSKASAAAEIEQIIASWGIDSGPANVAQLDELSTRIANLFAYHAFYGFYIWSRGKSNVSAYPWVGNRMFTLQRWTGLLAFLFIAWHLYDERFATHGMSTYTDVYNSMQNVWFFIFYLVGVTACCVHFGVGIWNFLCKWGLAATSSSQRAAGWLGVAVATVLVIMSITIIISFRYGWHPLNGYISQSQ